jgi:phage terminase large subunit-like protein
VLPTLNPQPVLQINIGATGSQFGRYSYVISGINPDEVYAAADKLQAKLVEYPGFTNPPRSDLFAPPLTSTSTSIAIAPVSTVFPQPRSKVC